MPRVYDMTKEHVKEKIEEYLPFFEIISYDRVELGERKDFVIKNNHYFFDISTTSFSEEVDPGWSLVDFDGRDVEMTDHNKNKYAYSTWLKMDMNQGRIYAKRVAQWRLNKRNENGENS